MFELLLKIILLWSLIDIVIIATAWYFSTTIKPYFPHWWQRVIADEVPNGEKF
jgi:hypothetical protein